MVDFDTQINLMNRPNEETKELKKKGFLDSFETGIVAADFGPLGIFGIILSQGLFFIIWLVKRSRKKSQQMKAKNLDTDE